MTTTTNKKRTTGNQHFAVMNRMVKVDETQKDYLVIKNKWWVTYYDCIIINRKGEPVYFDTKLAAVEYQRIWLPDSAEVQKIDRVSIDKEKLEPMGRAVRNSTGPRSVGSFS